ncbi:glycosyltransferase [Ruania alkalisoli]|uniref:Glycosyltransferase n=1 Tax=Ruania alkalisoli TaxID=2779775 RepID=A0A7M1SQC2_9MICO|nr:glycosyltransferase [Ruania alkalisoli]QOR69769.1 glycosyltransferase [Ruania alkalisoli]
MPAIDVTIVTSAHDVADARLHRQVAALRRGGLNVEVLGVGQAQYGPASAAVRTWRRRGPFGRALLAITLPWRARGTVLVALDPDSAFGTWVRTRLSGRRCVIDVHEDYRSVLADRSWAVGWQRWMGRLWARLGVLAASHADAVVVADEHLLPDLERRVLLRNLPDPAMLPEPAGPTKPPRALYIGDIRASRGLFTMLAAISTAPGWQLELIGAISDADRDRFEQLLAADPALAERVIWSDRLPPDQAWRSAATASVGLALLDDTPAFRDAMPSKVYEYLATGLPVLTTNLPRPAALVRSSGAGAVVADADAASTTLRSWLEQPAELDRLRAAAGDWRTSWLGRPPPTEAFVGAVSTLVARAESSTPEQRGTYE